MNLYVGVTDYDWFHYLAGIQPDEVNFWRPGGSQNFRALAPGEPFLFKLKAPHNAIAGGGFFVSYTTLPLTVAWETFGKKNGLPDYWAFRDKIHGYRSGQGGGYPNPTIGCVVLTSPFFFEAGSWIPVPGNWAPQIVTGKTYSMQEPHGRKLWDSTREQLAAERMRRGHSSNAPIVAEELARYGHEYVARNRLGQGAFRALVTDAYSRRCAFTGERTLPALEAAHIKPYTQSGPHRINNGLLLRADLHQLFDKGYMTLTKNLHVEVSRRIKEEFENGRVYYALHGQRLKVIPSALEEQPAQKFIEYHNMRIFTP